MIGVDRLDYTKGLSHRLRAFERFLEMAPGYHGRACLLQIAAPSRDAIPAYADHKAEVESLVRRINSRHGDADWTPVRYLNRTFNHSQVAVMLRLSRIGVVTPLRDGMNLVAKEYVAAQNPADPGVLVLSCFAGAAEQLKSALIVNPYDVDRTGETLRRAITMPQEERRARWQKAMAEIEARDIHVWHRRFLSTLENVAREAAFGRRIAAVGPVVDLPSPQGVTKSSPHTLTYRHPMRTIPAGSGKVTDVAARAAGTLY
jgi:trehalose 6-phosphate synthase